MISITVTADTAAANAFLVRIEGEIRRPKALNDRLARTLVKHLKAHFAERNREPNKLGGLKTNFWTGVRAGTMVGEVTDRGATVQVGVDTFFRIHLLGGVIKPVRATWLTIPLVPEARGVTAATYEQESGRKLFRLPGARVLLERTERGDRSLIASHQPSMRTRTGYKTFNLGAGMRVRAVYALSKEVTIKEDPRALPPREALAAALQSAADDWVAREMAKGKGAQPA